MNGVTVPAAYAVRASPDYVWGAGGHPIKLPTVQWAVSWGGAACVCFPPMALAACPERFAARADWS